MTVYVENNMLEKLKTMEKQLSEVSAEQKALDAQIEEKEKTIEALQSELQEGRKKQESYKNQLAGMQSTVDKARWTVLGRTLESLVKANTGDPLVFDFFKDYKSNDEFVKDFQTYIMLAVEKPKDAAATAVSADNRAKASVAPGRAGVRVENEERKSFPKRNEFHKVDQQKMAKEAYNFIPRK